MTEFLRSQLEVYFIEHKAEADRVADQVLINKRSREQAEKARLNIKKEAHRQHGHLQPRAEVRGLPQPRRLDGARYTSWRATAPSAPASSAGTQSSRASCPVRGKILNCLKADYGRIFKSEIITDLIKVLGCGVEVPKHAKELPAFELESLRWSKVIICTDADVDGFQIRTLILTMLYRLAPTLIREGLGVHRGVAALRDRVRRQDLVRVLGPREGRDRRGAGRRQGGHQTAPRASARTTRT